MTKREKQVAGTAFGIGAGVGFIAITAMVKNNPKMPSPYLLGGLLILGGIVTYFATGEKKA